MNFNNGFVADQREDVDCLRDCGIVETLAHEAELEIGRIDLAQVQVDG